MPKPTLEKDVLLKEYERVCADIRSYESYTDRIVGLGFTVLSIGMTVGLAQKVPIAFFVLPVALVGVLAYATMNARWVRELGAYKAHLEASINQLCGRDLLIWERLVLRNVAENGSFRVLWLVYALVTVAIFAVSVAQVRDHFGVQSMYGLLLVLLVLAALLLNALRELARVPTDAARRIAALSQT